MMLHKNFLSSLIVHALGANKALLGLVLPLCFPQRKFPNAVANAARMLPARSTAPLQQTTTWHDSSTDKCVFWSFTSSAATGIVKLHGYKAQQTGGAQLWIEAAQ